MSNWIGPTVKQLWNDAMHVFNNFFGFNINTTAFCLGRSSLHLLILKSSMTQILVGSVNRFCYFGIFNDFHCLGSPSQASSSDIWKILQKVYRSFSLMSPLSPFSIVKLFCFCITKHQIQRAREKENSGFVWLHAQPYNHFKTNQVTLNIGFMHFYTFKLPTFRFKNNNIRVRNRTIIWNQ